jgi:HIV Tat-specific factor 1
MSDNESNDKGETAAVSTESQSQKQDEAQVPSSSSSSLAASAENVTYENGVAIFTDEKTKYKYKWCKETTQWKPLENEHYRWCEDSQKWIPKAVENEYYRWCDKTNQWIPKMKQEAGRATGVYGYDEKEDCQIYTDQDGAVFLWVNKMLLSCPRFPLLSPYFVFYLGRREKSVVSTSRR